MHGGMRKRTLDSGCTQRELIMQAMCMLFFIDLVVSDDENVVIGCSGFIYISLSVFSCFDRRTRRTRKPLKSEARAR